MPLSNTIPFYYGITIALTGGATGQQTLTLAQDSTFELHGILGTGSQDAKTNFTNNSFSCQIQDQTSGRLLSNIRIPQVLLCGNAFQDLLERRPCVFQPGAVILFDFLELSGSNNTVTLVFKGYKQLTSVT